MRLEKVILIKVTCESVTAASYTFYYVSQCQPTVATHETMPW